MNFNPTGFKALSSLLKYSPIVLMFAPRKPIVDLSEVHKLIIDKPFAEIEKLADYGVTVKQHGDLYLLNTDTVPCVEGDIDNQLLHQQCTGIVFQKDTNTLVCANQRRIHEATPAQVQDMLQSRNPSSVRVEYCEDGTVMRVYHHNGAWHTATTNCIDATKSYWSSKRTFDDMFWEVFDKAQLNNMDTHYTYVFILLHKENRIVVKHKNNGVVYVGRICNLTLKEDFTRVFRNTWGLAIVKNIDVQRLYSNTQAFFDDNMYFANKRGLCIKVFDTNLCIWETWRLDFPKYTLIKEVRGNLPDIDLRYIELMQDPTMQSKLRMYYPEYKQLFRKAHSAMNKLVSTIYSLYVESHIKHTIHITEEHFAYRTLKQIHAQYKETNTPIVYVDVLKKLVTIKKSHLKMLLAEMDTQCSKPVENIPSASLNNHNKVNKSEREKVVAHLSDGSTLVFNFSGWNNPASVQ